MQVRPINETTLSVDFPAQIDRSTVISVLNLKKAFDRKRVVGIIDTWVGFHSLAIAFDPEKIAFEKLLEIVLSIKLLDEEFVEQKHHEIPVKYDLRGMDMEELSHGLNLRPEEVMEIHSSPEYFVALLGFLPGFPYLLGLPENLHFPRKSSPSLRLKPGSVAIGGAQTGIYPFESPGGWHVVGHTSSILFSKPDSFLLSPGDTIKFSPV